MKWIRYRGDDVSLPRLAEILGVERATLARRVREYEAGRLTLAKVVSRGRLHPTPPRKTSDKELRRMLRRARGNLSEVAKVLGVSRARVHQMAKRSNLVGFARSVARSGKLSMQTCPVPREALRMWLNLSRGKMRKIAKAFGVTTRLVWKWVKQEKLITVARATRRKAKQDARATCRARSVRWAKRQWAAPAA